MVLHRQDVQHGKRKIAVDVGYSRSERSWVAFVDLGPRVRVLGTWPNQDSALDAAKAYIEMYDTDRLCTPAEIVRVRRELAKAK